MNITPIIKSVALLITIANKNLNTPKEIQSHIDLLNPTKEEKREFYEYWRSILNNTQLPLSTLICVFPEEIISRFLFDCMKQVKSYTI